MLDTPFVFMQATDGTESFVNLREITQALYTKGKLVMQMTSGTQVTVNGEGAEAILARIAEYAMLPDGTPFYGAFNAARAKTESSSGLQTEAPLSAE